MHQPIQGGQRFSQWFGVPGVLARLQALLTDLSVFSRRGYSGGRGPGRCLGEWVGIHVIPWPHYDRRHTALYVMISSIWTQEWSVCVYTSWSPKRVPRPVLWHSSPGGEQTKKSAWAIRTPPTATTPTEDPLTQTAQWHQAEQRPAKNTHSFACTYTHALKHTPSTVKDYTHHIFIIVGGTWSQGQVNTLCLAAYEKGHLCGMYIKSISSVFASANWRKYQGVTFRWHPYRIWASLSTLDWRRCHIILMRWKSKVF